MTNCYKFSHVFYNHLNPNVSSNSLSYTFISHRWFSSRMSPPTDRGTSRSSSVGKLAGCLFQSIIKFILIFSPLINTLFFTTYQITLCVLQMLIIYFLPWIDHTFSITSVAYNWFSISFFLPINQWVNLLRFLLEYVKLTPVDPYGLRWSCLLR